MTPRGTSRGRSPRRSRPGFSLTELLFAIFILGTGLAMTAAFFPVAMRFNEESFNDTIGTIIW